MLDGAHVAPPLDIADIFELLTRLAETGWLATSYEGYRDDGTFGEHDYSLFKAAVPFRDLRDHIFSGDGELGDVIHDLGSRECILFDDDLRLHALRQRPQTECT